MIGSKGRCKAGTSDVDEMQRKRVTRRRAGWCEGWDETQNGSYRTARTLLAELLVVGKGNPDHAPVFDPELCEAQVIRCALINQGLAAEFRPLAGRMITARNVAVDNSAVVRTVSADYFGRSSVGFFNLLLSVSQADAFVGFPRR